MFVHIQYFTEKCIRVRSPWQESAAHEILKIILFYLEGYPLIKWVTLMCARFYSSKSLECVTPDCYC